jgi:hypothetical protein
MERQQLFEFHHMIIFVSHYEIKTYLKTMKHALLKSYEDDDVLS